MTQLKTSLLALFASLIIMSIGNSLGGILLPIRAESADFSMMDIGIMGAMYSVGFVIGCLYAPRIIKKTGLVGSFALMSLVSAGLTIIHPLAVDPIIWIGLRLLCGFTSAGIFSVIESWLNAVATPQNRGGIFAMYMMINLACQTGGRFGIMLDNPDTIMMFVVAAIIMAAAFIPITLVKSPHIQQTGKKTFPIRELWQLAPMGILGNLCFGLCGGAFSAMAPVYAQNNGLGMGAIAMFCSAASIGGAISQYPIGKAADRTDRRLILSWLCLAGVPFSMLLVVTNTPTLQALAGTGGMGSIWHGTILTVLSFMVGALYYPLYSVSISHVNDLVPPHRYVEASSTNLLIWGVGASIGPFIASGFMEIAGQGGLFIFMSVIMIVTGITGFCYYYQRRPFSRHPYQDWLNGPAGSSLTPASAAAKPATEA